MTLPIQESKLHSKETSFVARKSNFVENFKRKLAELEAIAQRVKQ